MSDKERRIGEDFERVFNKRERPNLDNKKKRSRERASANSSGESGVRRDRKKPREVEVNRDKQRSTLVGKVNERRIVEPDEEEVGNKEDDGSRVLTSTRRSSCRSEERSEISWKETDSIVRVGVMGLLKEGGLLVEKDMEAMEKSIKELQKKWEKRFKEQEKKIADLEKKIVEMEGKGKEWAREKVEELYEQDKEELKKEIVKEREIMEEKLVINDKWLRYKAEEDDRKRQKRRNIIITGKEFDNKEEIEDFILDKLEVAVEIEERWEIVNDRGKRTIAKCSSIKKKDEIMSSKSKLKGEDRKIYIDNDLTFNERMVQRQLRMKRRKEEEKGKKARVGYHKIMIDGVWFRYVEENDFKGIEPMFREMEENK